MPSQKLVLPIYFSQINLFVFDWAIVFDWAMDFKIFLFLVTSLLGFDAHLNFFDKTYLVPLFFVTAGEFIGSNVALQKMAGLIFKKLK